MPEVLVRLLAAFPQIPGTMSQDLGEDVVNPMHMGYKPIVDISVGTCTGELLGGHYHVRPGMPGDGDYYIKCTAACCANKPLAMEPAGCIFTAPGAQKHGGHAKVKKPLKSIQVAAHVDPRTPSLGAWLCEQGRQLELGASLVGRTVEVFWPREGKFYRGRISGFCAHKGCHHIQYEDEERELLYLPLEKYSFVDAPRPDSPATPSQHDASSPPVELTEPAGAELEPTNPKPAEFEPTRPEAAKPESPIHPAAAGWTAMYSSGDESAGETAGLRRAGGMASGRLRRAASKKRRRTVIESDDSDEEESHEEGALRRRWSGSARMPRHRISPAPAERSDGAGRAVQPAASHNSNATIVIDDTDDEEEEAGHAVSSRPPLREGSVDTLVVAEADGREEGGTGATSRPLVANSGGADDQLGEHSGAGSGQDGFGEEAATNHNSDRDGAEPMASTGQVGSGCRSTALQEPSGSNPLQSPASEAGTGAEPLRNGPLVLPCASVAAEGTPASTAASEGAAEEYCDNGDIWDYKWSPAAEATLQLRHQNRVMGAMRGHDLHLLDAFFDSYPNLSRKQFEAAARAYLSWLPERRRAELNLKAQVQVIYDPDIPAVAMGRLQGRSVERMLVSKGVKTGDLIGAYVGTVCTEREVDDAVASDPECKLGFQLDKIHAIDCTAAASSGWPEALLVNGGTHGNALRFMNSVGENEGGTENCRVVEVEERSTGRLHMLVFALQDVPLGDELLLFYGREYFRHLRTEGNRIRGLIERDERIEQQERIIVSQQQEIASLTAKVAQLEQVVREALPLQRDAMAILAAALPGGTS